MRPHRSRRRHRARLVIAASVAAISAVGAVPVASRAAPARAEPSCAPARHPGGDWPTYGKDASNTRNQSAEETIGPLEAAQLAPAWTFATSTADPGAGDVTGTPVVSRGCVFVGTNGGWIVALNADTGAVVWKTKLPDGGGINSSLVVSGDAVVAGISRTSRGRGCSGDACIGPYAVALDRATGRVRWSTPPLDRQRGADLYGSPAVHDGLVFLGISGGAAELGDEADRYAFQGSFVLIDLATGALVRKTWTIRPPDRDPAEPKDDFAGGAIWSTPAIDRTTGYAWVGSGNPFRPQAEHRNTNSVLKIDLNRARATFGTIVGAYKGEVDEYVPGLDSTPCYDLPGNALPSYPQGIGSCGDIDMDFGASPNLWREAGRLLVGTGQKSGVYHVVDGATMRRVRTALVGPPTMLGGIVGSTAFDSERVYGPVTVPGHVWAVGRRDASLRWVSPTADGLHWGNPVAVANGVVYTVDFKGFLDAYDAATGAPVLHRPIAGAATGTDPIVTWGGVSVARNTVYATVGISGLPAGYVLAFRPGARDDDGGDDDGGDDDGDGGGGGAPAPPAGATVVAGPGSVATTYTTPAVVVAQGAGASFLNADVPLHDVVSEDDLFRTDLIPLGTSVRVEGVERLRPGQYGFYCSIHRNMTGTLIVT